MKAFNTLLAAVIMALVCLCSSVSAAGPLTVDHLRCEYLIDPLGIDETRPRLSWISEFSQRGQKQTAYCILVASSRDKLDKNMGDLWDTSKVKSDQSIHVFYKGKPMESRMRCYWKVRVWDKDGKASNWSEQAEWSMGASGSPKSPLMKVQETKFIPVDSLAGLKCAGEQIIEVSSSHPGLGKEKMRDGSAETFWHTRYAPEVATPPHYVVLEVPENMTAAGVVYTPRSGFNARVTAYKVYVSDDGKNWGTPALRGEIEPSEVKEQKLAFHQSMNRTFVKFEVVNAVSGDGKSVTAIGELDVLVNKKEK